MAEREVKIKMSVQNLPECEFANVRKRLKDFGSVAAELQKRKLREASALARALGEQLQARESKKE